MPVSLDLEDTKVAFKRLSDTELAKSYLILKTLSFQPLVYWGPRLATQVLRLKLPVRGLIKKTFFEQFCGGESIRGCEKLIARQGLLGVGTILDYASEGVDNEAAFERSLAELLTSIEYARPRSDQIPFCVFKPTAIGSLDLMAKVSKSAALSGDEKSQIKRVQKRFLELGTKAHDAGVRLFCDAEESWIQPFVDKEVHDLMARFNTERAIIFTTAQMYRVDRLEYLNSLYELATTQGFKIGVKLVRGAYLEKETCRAAELGIANPVFAKKEDTDHSYNQAIEYIMQHHNQFEVCAGTHNEVSTELLAQLVDKYGIARDDERFQFAQLLGMSDHLTYNLVAAGYKAAKYVPYGPVEEVLPYLSRRAEENSSVKGQTSRELELLTKEKTRRSLERKSKKD